MPLPGWRLYASMFFPYSTDAPIYHWPYTTVFLIAVNACLCLATTAAPEASLPFILTFGDGYHPIQWITSNFLHAGLYHCLGNMLFLWAFGLIVEGKLGWYKTLFLYLGIGIIENVVVQTLMLHSSGGALGASGVVFGFMAICLVWAPENEVYCVTVVPAPLFRVFQFEIKVITLVGLFLLFQLVVAGVGKMAMSTEVLHLIGAAVGFPFAIVMLKAGLVDCEYWDVFSVWAGHNRMSRQERRQLEADAEAAAKLHREKDIQQAKRESTLEQIRELIESGRAEFAAKAHQQMQQKLDGWILPENDLLALIRSLHKASLWNESVPLMEEYLSQYSQQEVPVRLKLAQILAVEQHHFGRALEVLAPVDPALLDARQRQFLAKLQGKAKTA